jgi:hypothetical protein
MQKIPFKMATAGMVLARDVFRNDSPVGMPACGKGTVLTDVLLSRFEQINVQSIYVEGHPVKEAGDVSLEEMIARLDRRFEKVRQDPIAAKLKSIYAEYLKRSMGEDGGRQAE